jgi:hypothetical protein
MPKFASELMMMIANISAIVAIGMMAFKIRKYIEDRVQEALSKDEIIQKISLLVKPDMIFDEKGAIVADRGASAFIQDNGIHITCDDDNCPDEIRISFSKHMKIPPLLTSLNPDIFSVKSKRGKHHECVYKLEYTMTSDAEEGHPKLYRLEIL